MKGGGWPALCADFSVPHNTEGAPSFAERGFWVCAEQRVGLENDWVSRKRAASKPLILIKNQSRQGRMKIARHVPEAGKAR